MTLRNSLMAISHCIKGDWHSVRPVATATSSTFSDSDTTVQVSTGIWHETNSPDRGILCIATTPGQHVLCEPVTVKDLVGGRFLSVQKKNAPMYRTLKGSRGESQCYRTS